jgi:transcriptional regulator with XRE-family HTH domain
MEPATTTKQSEQLLYPSKQLRILKEFYGLRNKDIARRAGTGENAVNNALHGRGSVDLRLFTAIADALQADVVITLKPRDPQFIWHVACGDDTPTVPSSE